MNAADIYYRRTGRTGLYNINLIENLPSIMEYGILSYDAAEKIPHISVALQAVQDKRDQKTVPNGLRLHQYANLYFDARNPMMYRRQSEFDHLCVLKVSLDVLSYPDVVVSDQNAASKYAAFYDPSFGVGFIDFDMVFKRNWSSPDQIQHWRNSAAKCAEVLVPNRVEYTDVIAIAVATDEAKQVVSSYDVKVPIQVNPDLFFRRS